MTTSTITLTEEQFAVEAAAKATKKNLILYARAGAGKTFTLKRIATALSSTPILCLAFNVAIKKEMEAEFPRNVTTKTMNGLGHGVWQRRLGKRLYLNKSKVYQLTTNFIDSADITQDERKALRENLGDILRVINEGKAAGYLPSTISGVKPLISEDDFFSNLFVELDGLEIDLVRAVSTESWTRTLDGEIDFADQLLAPAVTNCTFPQYPLTLVDEAQDLSTLNHVLLKKSVGIDRLIAVGDPYQAIYGFRGAHEDSMDQLAARFKMTPLYLTTTFRCGKAIVKLASKRAPDIKARPDAHEGSVKHLSAWGPWNVPKGSAIICRNNAPLFSVILKFLQAGIRTEFRGNDVIGSLIKILRSFGPDTMFAETVHEKIDEWEEKQKRRLREKGVLADKIECLRLMADSADDLGGMIAYLTEIQNQTGSIHVMTGHKSKGLEYDNVFFLEPALLRDLDRDGNPTQDPNVRYVIQTRAIHNLNHVRLDNFTFVEPTQEKEGEA